MTTKEKIIEALEEKKDEEENHKLVTIHEHKEIHKY